MYTITQNLGNGWRMRTTTPAIDTRPIFLARSSVRSFLSLSLSEKNRPGDEATLHFFEEKTEGTELTSYRDEARAECTSYWTLSICAPYKNCYWSKPKEEHKQSFTLCAYAQQCYVFGRIGLCICILYSIVVGIYAIYGTEFCFLGFDMAWGEVLLYYNYTIYRLILMAFLLLSTILYFMRMCITPSKAHAYSEVQLAG